MKNKILLFSLAILGLFGAVMSFSAFAPPPPNPSPYFNYVWTQQTITNAIADTLTLPSGVNLLSRFTYNVQGVATATSGTTAVKCYLEESNLYSGNTDWVIRDSTNFTSLALRNWIKGDEVYGIRHRIRLKGTGTQSTKIDLTVIYKRK